MSDILYLFGQGNLNVFANYRFYNLEIRWHYSFSENRYVNVTPSVKDEVLFFFDVTNKNFLLNFRMVVQERYLA